MGSGHCLYPVLKSFYGERKTWWDVSLGAELGKACSLSAELIDIIGTWFVEE